MLETQVQSLDREDPLEESIGNHFSILAWRIPWTEELARGLQPMGFAESQTRLKRLSSSSNLPFQDPFVPISLRPVLRIVAADVVGTVCHHVVNFFHLLF